MAALSALILVIAVFAAGCGGKRGDAGASTDTFKATVLKWEFAKKQSLGKTYNFVVVVRNDDTKEIPQLVITVKGLREFVKQTGTASDTRPIWLPNDVSYSDVTPNSSATGSTFTLGALAAGEEKRYELPLTPIRRGEHRIGYVLAGNLYGTARIELDNGDPAASMRRVLIDPKPVFDESVFD